MGTRRKTATKDAAKTAEMPIMTRTTTPTTSRAATAHLSTAREIIHPPPPAEEITPATTDATRPGIECGTTANTPKTRIISFKPPSPLPRTTLAHTPEPRQQETPLAQEQKIPNQEPNPSTKLTLTLRHIPLEFSLTLLFPLYFIRFALSVTLSLPAK
ncbi:hypothetical protein FRC08_007016 [Ceratobasidium sp. 394]|nr:hypothetical protein FRC08_007016 [Ceratobasidium sp. 394]